MPDEQRYLTDKFFELGPPDFLRDDAADGPDNNTRPCHHVSIETPVQKKAGNNHDLRVYPRDPGRPGNERKTQMSGSGS